VTEPNRRRRRRIGVLLCLLSAAMAILVLTGGEFESADLLALPILLLLGTTGIGLLFDLRPARIGAALLLTISALAAGVELVMVMIESLPHLVWTASGFLALANAVATTLFLVWLHIRAVQVLLDRPLRPGPVTARLTGALLVLVAALHLQAALEHGDAWGGQGAWSLSVSASGTHLAGFPGWGLWHVALLPVAGALLLGRGRLLRHAAAALTALLAALALLIPLGTLLADPEPAREAGETLFAVVLALGPVFLAWWLRDELATAPRP
jgi:hypothetical protein